MSINSSIFKSICEDILAPAGVKVGGYKDELFTDLSDERRDELSCQICYMVVKDPQRCENNHLFCAACIFAWSMTSETNTDRCPVCRVRGTYAANDMLKAEMNCLDIRCIAAGCRWKGILGDYRKHKHGLEDAGVDPHQAGLPAVRSLSGDTVFPDILANDDIGSSVRSHRSQAQRRHLNAQLNLIDCQARLAFLMDVFEEDLQRHRTNLASLIRAQQRYNNAEREEIIRLERELRDMTGNLLSLIESATHDVNRLTDNIASDTRTDYSAAFEPTPRYNHMTSPTLSGIMRPLSRLGVTARTAATAEETNLETTPLRRARFFQRPAVLNNSQSNRLSEAVNVTNRESTEAALIASRSPDARNDVRDIPPRAQRLLDRRPAQSQTIRTHSSIPPPPAANLSTSNLSTSNPSAPDLLTDSQVRRPDQGSWTASQSTNQTAANPFAITWPPRPPPSRSNPFTITYPPRAGDTPRISRASARRNMADRRNNGDS